MKNNLSIMLILASFFILYFTQMSKSYSDTRRGKNEIVYIQGSIDYFFYLKNNEVLMKKWNRDYVKLNNNRYNPWDYKSGKVGYAKYDVKKDITIKDSSIFFRGKKVILPKGAKFRTFWDQAVLWHNMVILLGRTSLTDGTANLKPPFFNTELIYFSIKDMKANIITTDFTAPEDHLGILVLAPMK